VVASRGSSSLDNSIYSRISEVMLELHMHMLVLCWQGSMPYHLHIARPSH
jgi:hypothetical protein